MAILPHNGNDPGVEYIITSIEKDVLIIKNPGLDNEEVLHRFTDLSRFTVGHYRGSIINDKRLSLAQQFDALFWLGYFYRSSH